MKTFSTIIIATAMAVGFAAPAAQIIFDGVTTLDVVADIMLRDGTSYENTNQNSDGRLIVGDVPAGLPERALLRFDTSSLSIPDSPFATVTVNSVTLRGYKGSTSGGGDISPYVYDYAYEFGETTATWNNPAGDGSDVTAGGSYSDLLTSIASFSGSPDPVTFASTAAFIGVVETAITGDNTVNLLIKDNGETGADYKSFVSREDNNTNAFDLIVDYTVTIPEPSTALLAGLGLMGVCFRRRRR